MVMLSLSNTCTKPRICFLRGGETLPGVIKQPERTCSTYENANISLFPGSQNTEDAGDLLEVYCGVARHGLTQGPAGGFPG